MPKSPNHHLLATHAMYFCRIFCLFAFCFFVQKQGFAQTFQPAPGPLLVSEVAFEQANECTIFFDNPSGNLLQLRWRSGEVSKPDGWDIDLCDYGLCYSGIPASGTMNPIWGNTQAYLKLIVQPDTVAGAGWLWFRVLEAGNDSNYVDVYFSLHTPGTSSLPALGAGPAALRVFPNPASDAIFLKNVFAQKTARARVLSAEGALRWEGEIPAGETATVGTSNWPRGIYFVQTTGTAPQKVVLR
jgi:hypothetical protein